MELFNQLKTVTRHRLRNNKICCDADLEPYIDSLEGLSILYNNVEIRDHILRDIYTVYNLEQVLGMDFDTALRLLNGNRSTFYIIVSENYYYRDKDFYNWVEDISKATLFTDKELANSIAKSWSGLRRGVRVRIFRRVNTHEMV